MRKYAFAITALICMQVKAQILGTSAIDSLVENARKKFDVPGIAVAVIRDGKIVHIRDTGCAP
jgi:CubicO group peptidase (beta-lactamase class C family)